MLGAGQARIPGPCWRTRNRELGRGAMIGERTGALLPFLTVANWIRRKRVGGLGGPGRVLRGLERKLTGGEGVLGERGEAEVAGREC